MRIRRSLLAGFTSALLAVPFAFAQGAPPEHGPGRWKGEAMMGMHQGAAPMGRHAEHAGRFEEHQRVAMLTDVLQLTEQQQSSWQKIREKTRTTVQPMAKQAFALRKEVRDSLEAGNADPATIGKAMIQAHELQLKIRAAIKAGRDAFAALLTPEQTAKLHTLQQARHFMRPRGSRGQPPAGS